MKKYRFQITIGSLFLLAGFLLMSDPIFNSIRTAHATPAPIQVITGSPQKTVTDTTVSKTVKASALPTHISSESVGLSIDILPGYYDATSQTWTLSDNAAYFAAMTTVPNTVSGITYIYGHHTKKVFLPLNNLSIGDTVTIDTADGTQYTYSLLEFHDLNPADSSWLRSQPEKPQLILQTCAGPWDQYRRVYVFDLVKA